jgi:predicted PurR-regulated permease PerM
MRHPDWARLRDQSVVALTAVALTAVFIWLIGHVIGTIALIAIAVVLALVLEPLMVMLGRRMPRLVAAALVYVVFLGGVGVIGFLLWPAVKAQVTGLAAALPNYLTVADGYVAAHSPQGLHLGAHPVTDALTKGGVPNGGAGNLALQAATFFSQVAEGMAEIVFILVLAFYFMVDGNRMRAGIARLFPREHQAKIRFVEDTVSQVLGSYVRSQLIMAALMGFSAGLGCWLLGVRYPAIIAVLAFLAELVPLVGPFLAAIPAMLIAIFQSFGLMVEVTFFFVFMQMAENAIIRPRITGPMVGLHPVEALLALVVGAQTAGFWGALFAVPAVGIAVVLINVAWKAWRGEPLVHDRRGMKLEVIEESPVTPPPKPAASRSGRPGG